MDLKAINKAYVYLYDPYDIVHITYESEHLMFLLYHWIHF